MARRPKLYTIDWPLTPEKAENINELFEILFDDLASNLKVVLTTDVQGVLPVPNGGTGAATLTGVLKGNGVNPVTAVTPLTVVDGGTGAATLTGILKGNGASAVSAIALPADATKFLDGTGAFTAPVTGVNMAVVMTRVVLGI